MVKSDFKKIQNKLSDGAGIYIFKKGKKILYVGKATSLRDRVRSYFSSDLMRSRGPLLVKMFEEAEKVETKTTNSVLEALILEAHYIKKYKPDFNTKEKDDKSYNYVVITDEEFPRVLIVRDRELNLKTFNLNLKTSFGPFPHGTQLREALKIVRKIFPFRDRCTPFDSKLKNGSRPCFNYQIGLCPGVCVGKISSKEYGRTIKNLSLFFSGQTKKVKKALEKEMKLEAKAKEFEKAEKTKKTIFALDHIQDVSLLKNSLTADSYKLKASYRIEAYDIAHISGLSTVGVMVVIEDGQLNKSEYRKFKVRGDGKITVDDIKNLKEIVTRRFGHPEWPLPNLIVVDGGIAQVNAMKAVLKENKLNIEVVSVVKDERHKPKDFLGKETIINKYKKDILLVNNESHRFAISYHRKTRGGGFLTKNKK